MSQRITGRVKWFNEDKGYGFIARDDGGDDVFLHFSALNMPGFKTIADDTPVEFEVEENERGLAATNVTTL